MKRGQRARSGTAPGRWIGRWWAPLWLLLLMTGCDDGDDSAGAAGPSDSLPAIPSDAAAADTGSADAEPVGMEPVDALPEQGRLARDKQPSEALNVIELRPIGPQPYLPVPTVRLDACFDGRFVASPAAPDYSLVEGQLAHCAGTGYTRIEGLRDVVLLGGVPGRVDPLQPQISLQDHLARALTARFPDLWLEPGWAETDPGVLRSGAFRLCSRLNAVIADLSGDDGLIAGCLPAGHSGNATLFIVIIGEEDLRALAAEVAAGEREQVRLQGTHARLRALKRAIGELRKRFPPAAIVLANATDWSDGTGETGNCPDWPAMATDTQRAHFAEIAAHFATGFMDVALAHRAELVLLYENACGHGSFAPAGSDRCQGGVKWITETCRQLTPEGSAAITALIMQVIRP
jgi:hypothetical protein